MKLWSKEQGEVRFEHRMVEIEPPLLRVKRLWPWATVAGVLVASAILVMAMPGSPSAPPAQVPGPVQVAAAPASLDEKRAYTYQIYSADPTGKAASVTWAIDDDGTVRQASNVKLPLEKTIPFEKGEWKSPSVTAVGTADTYGIRCRILAEDGEVLDEKRVDGTSKVVTCSARD